MFLPKFRAAEFYPIFRERLNQTEINTDHTQKNLNTTVTIKYATAIRPEEQYKMVEMLEKGRKIYMIEYVGKTKCKEYKEEMIIPKEEMNKIRRKYMARIPSDSGDKHELGSHGRCNEEETRGLDLLTRRRNILVPNEIHTNTRPI